MTTRLLIVTTFALLAGCDTTDARMGLATAHNAAAQQAAAQDVASAAEGGSAARGVGAQRRYLTGNVRQPANSAAEPATVPGDAAPPSPK